MKAVRIVGTRLRWGAMAVVIAVALIVPLVFLYRDRLLQRWLPHDDFDNAFAPGALADYVPEDSEAVLAVNVASLRQSAAGSRYLGPSLRQILVRAERRLAWIDLLGLQPLDDLDTLQISFAPGSGAQPLWLGRGRLNRARFQTGPDKLHEATVDHFRVWQWDDRRSKRATLIAPLGDTIVVSQTRQRVFAALKQASNPQALSVRDVVLRDLLAKVDRRQTVWFAASVRGLGALDGFKDALLSFFLGPVLRHADSIHGGIACAEDVRAEVHFQSGSDEDAERLESTLVSIRDLAGDVPPRLLGGQGELRPLLRLLAAATVRRDGRNIHFRCRLAMAQLEGRE